MKIFVIKINWFINGIIGTNINIHPKLGSDFVVFNGEESDILLFCEDLIDTFGQSSRFSHFVLNYKDKKIEEISNFESRYWSFDNVNNFGLVNYEVISSYSLKDFKENKINDKLVCEAVENRKFYSL